jgi:hypothetical protein
MAALGARFRDSRALGFSGDGATAASFADHALDTLALFGGPQGVTCGDRAANLSAGLLYDALLLASSLAPSAGDVLVLYASLTQRARDDIVASMSRWVVESWTQALGTPAGAMATIEAFQRSASSIVLDDTAFDVGAPMPAARLFPGDQAAAATLTTFSSATTGAWCLDGDTCLLVLTRQAIGGPMPTAAAVWGAGARAQAVAVFRAMTRRAAQGATAGECLFTAADVLRARSLTLGPTWRAGAFERLLTALPGDAYDPPIARFLGAALPRMPWLACALLDRPDRSMSGEDAAADLLSSHGMGPGVGAVTQNNLKVLESKAKATLSIPGKPGSNRYDRLRGTGIAAHASTSGPGGDARARFDAVAFEAVVQSLSGYSWEDTHALLRTLYSVIRRMFAGKQSRGAIEMLNRTCSLASGFAADVARRIIESDVCGAGPQLDAVLSETAVRSFLDGNLFLDFLVPLRPAREARGATSPRRPTPSRTRAPAQCCRRASRRCASRQACVRAASFHLPGSRRSWTRSGCSG